MMGQKEFRDVKLVDLPIYERKYQACDEHFRLPAPLLPSTSTFRVEGMRKFSEAFHRVNETMAKERHCFVQERMIERQIPPFLKITHYFLES